MSYQDVSYEDLKIARDRARDANDSEVVTLFQKEMTSRPDYHAEAYGNANAAGDYEYQQKYLKSYNESFGDVERDNLGGHKLWLQNASKLHQARTGKDFEGTDEELADWGASQIDDLEYSTIDQIGAVMDWSSGKTSKDEKMALLDMYTIRDKTGHSWEGAWEAGKRMINPMDSPETLATLGTGAIVRRAAGGAAKKAAISAVRKKLMKEAGSEFGKGLAEKEATRLVGQGVRAGLKGKAALLAPAAISGGSYGGLHDATRQAAESGVDDADYDATQGAGKTALGASIGAVLPAGASVAGRTFSHLTPKGSLANKALRSGSGAQIADSKKLVEHLGGTSPEVNSRLMQSFITKYGDGDDVALAGTSGTEAAYKQLSGKMSKQDVKDPGLVTDVIFDAIGEPITDSQLLLKELKAITKAHGLPERMIKEAGRAQKASRTLGVTPEPMIVDAAELAKLPPKVRDRIADLAQDLTDSYTTISGLHQHGANTVGKQGWIEATAGKPEIAVLADAALNYGYIATRAISTLTGAGRVSGASKRLKGGLDKFVKAKDSSEAIRLPGVSARLAMAEPQLNKLKTSAATADKAVASKKWGGLVKASKERQKIAKQIELKKLERREAIDASKMFDNGMTAHGGIQGQTAVRTRLSRVDAMKELSKMYDESLISGGVKGKEKAKLIGEYMENFDANLSTKQWNSGSKAQNEKIYYGIQEELTKRGRKMSDDAYKGYLTNVVKEGGRLSAAARQYLSEM